uniref:Dirigent protein n=1 Tax=Lotus japonicus TaxID=34305 RepID=I3SRB6_LOTJA|nr:unknown [Lotus japonicus]
MTNSSKTISATLLVSLALITFLFSSTVNASYYEKISPTQLGFKEEKPTHLRFFFHDIVTGPKPSMVISVESPIKDKSKSPLPFGSIVVMEDPLTLGPELDSNLIGKAQGFYMTVAQEAELYLELIMGMTFTFMEGEFNGSTLTVMGRNTISSPIREMPIVGGTGAFRFARGFVQPKTYQVDYYKGDAVVEYNVYVFHYTSPSSFWDV